MIHKVVEREMSIGTHLVGLKPRDSRFRVTKAPDGVDGVIGCGQMLWGRTLLGQTLHRALVCAILLLTDGDCNERVMAGDYGRTYIYHFRCQTKCFAAANQLPQLPSKHTTITLGTAHNSKGYIKRGGNKKIIRGDK